MAVSRYATIELPQNTLLAVSEADIERIKLLLGSTVIVKEYSLDYKSSEFVKAEEQLKIQLMDLDMEAMRGQAEFRRERMDKYQASILAPTTGAGVIVPVEGGGYAAVEKPINEVLPNAQ